MSEIKIKSRERVLDGFFAVDKIYLQFPGSNVDVRRYMVITQNAAGVLVHRVDTDSVVLISQYRMAVLENKNRKVTEIPAGVFNEGEDAEDCARRECLEETGYNINALQYIGSHYASPGYTTEKYELYYAPVMAADKTEEGGGLADEFETIDIHEIPFAEAMERIDNGSIQDAKTVLSLLWLYRQKQISKK